MSKNPFWLHWRNQLIPKHAQYECIAISAQVLHFMIESDCLHLAELRFGKVILKLDYLWVTWHMCWATRAQKKRILYISTWLEGFSIRSPSIHNAWIIIFVYWHMLECSIDQRKETSKCVSAFRKCLFLWTNQWSYQIEFPIKMPSNPVRKYWIFKSRITHESVSCTIAPNARLMSHQTLRNGST